MGIWKRAKTWDSTDLIALKQDLDERKTLTELSDAHFAAFLRFDIGESNFKHFSKIKIKKKRFNKGIMLYKNLHTPSRSEKTLVTVIYGPTNIGKSTSIRERFPTAYWLSAPARGQSVWWDGYDGHDTVVIDEFYGWLEFSVIQRLLDFTPYQVQTKGGFQNFNSKRIFFTANEAPTSWYKNISMARQESLFRRIEVIFHKQTFTKFSIEKHYNNPPQIDLESEKFPVDLAETKDPYVENKDLD